MAASAQDHQASLRLPSSPFQETHMKVALVTFTRKGAPKEFIIGDRSQIIGRSPETDIRIPVSDVSRSHCEISATGKKVMVRDLGSSNGTFVNDQRVSDAVLKPGDRIRVGPVQFTVQIDGVPAKIAPPQPGAPAAKAPSEATTRIVLPASAANAGSEELDIDQLEELDSEDLSDFDIDDIDGSSGVIDEIENLEEISEDDLIPDDDSKNAK
jgi:pSer/pThr/pTyr-binding forkhead associated (FHA) protein